MVHFIVQDLIDFIGALVGHFGFDVHFEQVCYCRFELGLDKSELFVDLVSQDLSEYAYVVVLGWVCLDAWDDAAGGFDGEVL